MSTLTFVRSAPVVRCSKHCAQPLAAVLPPRLFHHHYGMMQRDLWRHTTISTRRKLTRAESYMGTSNVPQPLFDGVYSILAQSLLFRTTLPKSFWYDYYIRKHFQLVRPTKFLILHWVIVSCPGPRNRTLKNMFGINHKTHVWCSGCSVYDSE